MHTLIEIDGNIGAGKTTMINMLKKHNFSKKIFFIDEPLAEWEALKCSETNKSLFQLFYNNLDRWSFSFQIFALFTRIRKIKEILSKEENPIIITERGILTDKMVFKAMLDDQKHIHNVESKIYDEMNRYFENDFLPEILIYLYSPPEVCIERIRSRGRAGEEEISLSYLIDCDKYHEKLFESFTKVKHRIFSDDIITSFKRLVEIIE